MNRRRTIAYWLCAGLLTLALVGATATTADAHARVFFGFSAPIYYPPPYYAPYYPYPVYAPYYAEPAVPPPGWVPGHWAWRHDAGGRRFRVWVPAHLQ